MRISKNEDGEFLGLTSDYKNANEFKSIVALKFSITAPIAVNRVAWMKQVTEQDWVMSTNLDRDAKQFYAGTVAQPKSKSKKKAKKVAKVEDLPEYVEGVSTIKDLIVNCEPVKLGDIELDEVETNIGGFTYVDNDQQYAPVDDEENISVDSNGDDE